MTPRVKKKNAEARKRRATKETKHAERKELHSMYGISSILAFTLICGFGIGFFFLGRQQNPPNRTMMIYGLLAVWIGAGIGVATHLLASPPNEKGKDDPAARVLEKLTAQNDAQNRATMRPYMAVSDTKLTIDVGKPIKFWIKFKNTGPTPAKDVRFLGNFEKGPLGALVDRTYSDNSFLDGSQQGDVGGGLFLETWIDGHVLTQAEHDEWLSGPVQIVAHGVLRYSSKYIDGGYEDLRWCFRFDPDRREMFVCGPLLSTNNPTGKS